jgi:IQ domain-containing protein G
VAVLEETVEKLSFLGSITPDVLAHRDELSKFVGDEISRIITEQSGLEARYEDLITERGNLKGLANKSRYKEVQEEIAEVSRALRESTKQLCRNLKDNPNISGNLIKIQRERSELIEVSFFHHI